MPIYKHLAGKQHRLRAVLHMGNDDAEIVASFAQYGILPENLSDTIGGLLCDDDFTLWVDERQRIEWSRGASAHDAGNA